MVGSNKAYQQKLDSFEDYFLKYMLDYETRNSPSRLLAEKFQTPFDYRLKLLGDGEPSSSKVDLMETFNYLLGLQVNKIKVYTDSKTLYRVIFGNRKDYAVVVIWRDTVDLDLAQDKKFIEKEILGDVGNCLIFINGDSYVENAIPIEPEFKRLMEA